MDRRSRMTAAGKRDLLRLAALGIGLCLLLTGCGGGGTPITPVPPAVLEAILAYFIAQKHLNLTGNTRRAKEHRHRAFFVWRRAIHLGERNAAWAAEANQTTLKARIDSEYGAVEAYAARQLGTSGSPGPFAGGTDSIVPPHLDLADVARRYTNQTANSSTVRNQARENIDDRRVFTSAIIWRAAAIHDDLWQPSPDGRSATLKQPPSPQNANDVLLNEILDRRLRCVERMSHNVSDNSVMGGSRWPAVIANPHSGWRDGFRIRMFQYPRVPKNRQFDALLAGSAEWTLGERRTRYEYQIKQVDAGGRLRYQGLYFPPSQEPHWRAAAAPPGQGGYHQFLMAAAGTTPAQVIDNMFIPTPPNKWEDWWGRTWMWCDHVIAAIHLEALLLGKRRREPSAARKDDAFNAVATRSTGYASVGALVGMASRAMDINLLMADDDDPVFNNVVVPVRDLEVGDQLIFWNSFIYTLISTGDWRLENAFVMEIDSEPREGVNRRGTPPTLQLKLQGHGTASTLYGQYTQIIANKLIGAMRHVQEQVRDAVAANAAVTSIHYTERPATEFVKWTPYEDFRSPGAWWIRITQGQYRAWGFANVRETVQGIQKAVGHDSGHVLNDAGTLVTVPTGPGYHSPPDTASVYFPIFEPRIPGAWNAYLRGRAGATTFGAPDRLNDLRVDGSIMPGLFYRGISQPIPVVRPKVN